MQTGNLSDQLRVWGFENNIVIFTDGSMGFGLEATPLDVSCYDDDSLNQLSDNLAQLLNGLPQEIDIQFIQEIKSGNRAVIDAHKALGEHATISTAKELANQRSERLIELDEAGLLPRHRLKLFVRRKMAGPLIQKPKFFSKEKLFPDIAENRFKQDIAATERVKSDLIQNLKSIGITVSDLSTEQIANLMYEQWNPTRNVPLSDFDPDDVRHSLLFTDVSIYENGFSLSKMHHRIISLKILPERTFSSMARMLRDLPFDSRLFLSVHLPNQQRELESLQTQRRIAFSMAYGKREGVRDLDGQAKFHDLEELLEQMVAQGEKVFYVSLNILLRSTSEEELENQVSQTLLALREMGGAEGMEEGLAAFDIFSEFAIPHAVGRERQKRVKTSNLCDLLPLYGPWSGHESPSLLLRSRMGSLVSFDPFSAELTNANQIISGGSGAGKSYLTNILLLQMLKENPRIFIVDIGGSYKKACENLGGQYIALGANSDFAINPFDLMEGESTPSSQKIKFILGLVDLMTKEDGDTRLPKLERAEIEDAIQRVYESGISGNLSRLQELLSSHEESSIRRYARILNPWCGNTPYGKFFDRQTTVQINNPIVCFDLKGLEEFPELQAVCLFIITDFVWREVQKDRSTKKFLVLDECWKLLESEAGSSFIGEVFRTFRKYRASAIAISQNIDDFARSKVSTAILPNAAIKWILMQKGSDQARLKEVLQLNDNELSLVQSLRQERGHYSEAFLIAGDHRAVVAVESTPLEYWIATTDPNDLAQIDQIQKVKRDLDSVGALRLLAEKYPHGFAAGPKEQERV